MQHGILRANLCSTEFYDAKFHAAWNLWNLRRRKSSACGSVPFRAEVASDLAYQNACEDERRA